MWKGWATSSRVRVTMTVGQLVRMVHYLGVHGGYEELECMVCGLTLTATRGLGEFEHRRGCPVGEAYRPPRVTGHQPTLREAMDVKDREG